MVLIKEFRIVMPFNLEQYRRGSRYSVAKVNKEVTNGAEGIELLESKDYVVDEATGEKGRYTKKVYHLENRVPGWVRVLAPKSALKLDEESWDAFPHSKTVITNRFFGERFQFTIESRHFIDDLGEQENVMNLNEDQLKKRTIHKMDIGAEKLADKNEYKESEDPKLFKSQKYADKFSPLLEGWQEKAETKMCCYKVVTVQFKVFGVQGRGESYLMDMETQIFLKFHKEIFCWLDEWFGMSIEEIVESETKFYGEMADKLDVPPPEEGEQPSPETNGKTKKSKKNKDQNADSASSSSPSSPGPSKPDDQTPPDGTFGTPAVSPGPDASEAPPPTKKSSKKDKS